MIECYLTSQCNHKDCDKDFCLRKYKMDSLYSAALITDNQRQHISLKIDSDGTDLEEFKKLAEIEQSIETFIQEGKNLFIHSSNCGNGKSSWSLRLAEAYLNKIWARSKVECRVLFISVPRFLLALKDNISAKNSYVEYIKENVNIIIKCKKAYVNSDLVRDVIFNFVVRNYSSIEVNFSKKDINVELAKKALEDIITEKKKKITPQLVIETVEKRFNLKEGDLKSKSKSKNIAFPRQIAMYVLNEYTDLTYKQIGEAFGGLDHTTVLYGCNKIKSGKDEDPSVNSAINDILKDIKN